MSTTSPEPELPGSLPLAPSGPLPGTWSLVTGLVVAHVATAALYASRGGMGTGAALLLNRSVRFRVTAGGQYGPMVADGEWWRLVRSIGLHADALHLAVNAIAILVLGRLLEPWVGPVRLLFWFGLAGLGGSIASQLAGLTQSDGASGGAFGLLGATIVLGVRHREALDPADRPVVTRWLPGFLVANVVLSLVLPFVDAIGHLGGLAVGVLVALLSKPLQLQRPDGIAGSAIPAAEAIAVLILFAIALVGPSL